MKSLCLGLLSFACTLVQADQSSVQTARPPGSEKSATTKTLEIGARMLQKDAPPEQLNIYLVGFHPMKDDPSQQMEAHHFCKQVNEEFAQCVLFDGNSAQANLNGVEYIISERIYDQLPQAEKQYWHPHNYEILSGQLTTPGIPEAAEKQLLKMKMNSYGKTFHVWHTGTFGTTPDALPLGQPSLAWSFNHDGEAKPGLVEQRDAAFRINTAEKRDQRKSFEQLAKPQGGVEAVTSKFAGPLRSIPGVSDAATAARR
jgi:hypothetical protein